MVINIRRYLKTMFAVIEYTNYRKEVSIRVHGYATSEEKATKFAEMKIAAKHPGHLIEPLDDDNEVYVWIASPDRQAASNVVCEYQAVDWRAVTDKECQEALTCITDQQKYHRGDDEYTGPTDNSQVTVLHFLKFYEVCQKDYAVITENFDIAELVGNNLTRCKELLDFLMRNRYGQHENRRGHIRSVSSQVYAVVRVPEIP